MIVYVTVFWKLTCELIVMMESREANEAQRNIGAICAMEWNLCYPLLGLAINFIVKSTH